MGIDHRKSGRRQVLALLFVLPPVLGLGWCFYDAYWPRPLPLAALYQVGGQGQVVAGDERSAALHLPYPLPRQALLVELDNRSRFYLRSAKVVFVVKAADGRILSIEETPCHRLGSAAFELPPARAERPNDRQCVAPLGPASLRALGNGEAAGHDWYFSELHGRQAPIRLIGRPLELFTLMFERVYD